MRPHQPRAQVKPQPQPQPQPRTPGRPHIRARRLGSKPSRATPLILVPTAAPKLLTLTPWQRSWPRTTQLPQVQRPQVQQPRPPDRCRRFSSGAVWPPASMSKPAMNCVWSSRPTTKTGRRAPRRPAALVWWLQVRSRPVCLKPIRPGQDGSPPARRSPPRRPKPGEDASPGRSRRGVRLLRRGQVLRLRQVVRLGQVIELRRAVYRIT